MPPAPRDRTLCVRIVNGDRIFTGPVEVVIGAIAELLSGRPAMDASGVIDTLVNALDRNVTYEIEVGGTDPARHVDRIVGRLLEAGLEERRE